MVYQIKLYYNRQQESCHSKQSYVFFYKSQETFQSNINFDMGQSYKQISISRDITQSSISCTNYIIVFSGYK